MADLIVYGTSRGAPKHYTELPRTKMRYLAIRTVPNSSKLQVIVGAEDLNNVARIGYQQIEKTGEVLVYENVVEFLEDWTNIFSDQL
ncbi:hypothetical protein KBK19_19270 [Microvirga sp. STR05]|uniref:Uncharacterized protein n=1 Tax=Hymenobacter duratus TaxID=2771356 RepID=A0ABR8JN78_9BACT|nr:hypothetical protein [Hymenobacter duratus]MBD2717193.1 hypothetical protein [Hymenobacter duratus]MBR7952109.1 hypothetical protein [Microvirga sp. STR05]